MEDRLVNIEIKIANQENLLEQLSSIIYQQQIKIDKLEQIVKALEHNSIFDIGTHNVKPPHY
jgi:SlyX protein